jgi:hypothetical protein
MNVVEEKTRGGAQQKVVEEEERRTRLGGAEARVNQRQEAEK